MIGLMQPVFADGKQFFRFAARKVINGSGQQFSLDLGYNNSDNSPFVEVTDSAAWRRGIEAASVDSIAIV